MSSANQSNVGSRQIYEANEQRVPSNAELEERARYREGPPSSHLPQDSKDQRSIANRLAREEERRNTQSNKDLNEEEKLSQKNPTLPASVHGNEPSRGAQIDAELQQEEEEELRRKGKK